MTMNKKADITMWQVLAALIIALVVFVPSYLFATKLFGLNDNEKKSFTDLLNEIDEVNSAPAGKLDSAFLDIDQDTVFYIIGKNVPDNYCGAKTCFCICPDRCKNEKDRTCASKNIDFQTDNLIYTNFGPRTVYFEKGKILNFIGICPEKLTDGSDRCLAAYERILKEECAKGKDDVDACLGSTIPGTSVGCYPSELGQVTDGKIPFTSCESCYGITSCSEVPDDLCSLKSGTKICNLNCAYTKEEGCKAG